MYHDIFTNFRVRLWALCGTTIESNTKVENVFLVEIPALIRKKKKMTIILLPLVCICPRGKLWFSSVSKTPVHDSGMFNRWWIAGTRVLFFSCSRRKKENSVLRLQRLLKRSVQKGAKNEEGCTSLLRFTRSFWKRLWTYIWEHQSHTGTRKSYWFAREFDLRKSSRNDEGYSHNKF